MSLTTEIAQDIDDCFLNTDDFAEDVSYTENGESAVTISVIWSDSFTIMDPQTEVVSHVPACMAKASDISGNGEGDTIVKDSTTYYVTRILGGKVDGMVRLLLSKRAIHG